MPPAHDKFSWTDNSTCTKTSLEKKNRIQSPTNKGMEAGDPDPKLSRLISGSVMEGVSPFSPEIDSFFNFDCIPSGELTYPTFGKENHLQN